MNFKMKVAGLLAIYVKENARSKTGNQEHMLLIVKGLLEAMDVAHADRNNDLFQRLSTILTSIVRTSMPQSPPKFDTEPQKAGEEETAAQAKEKKILFTELLATILKYDHYHLDLRQP